MPVIPRGRVVRRGTVRTGDGRTVHVVVTGRWDVRDLLGHYAKREDEMAMCPHACCRHRRPHPEKLPVKFDRAVLRGMSERELERELHRYANFYDERQGAFRQIMGEIDRRDLAHKAAAQSRARRREHYRTRASEHRDEVYRQFLMAEAQTNGYMLNKAGKRADIDPMSLLTGPESRVRKYASEELIRYFEQHGRPTRVSFLGTARERREHLAGRRIY